MPVLVFKHAFYPGNAWTPNYNQDEVDKKAKLARSKKLKKMESNLKNNNNNDDMMEDDDEDNFSE